MPHREVWSQGVILQWKHLHRWFAGLLPYCPSLLRTLYYLIVLIALVPVGIIPLGPWIWWDFSDEPGRSAAAGDAPVCHISWAACRVVEMLLTQGPLTTLDLTPPPADQADLSLPRGNKTPTGLTNRPNKCSRVAVKWQSPIEVQGIDVFYTSLANVASQFSYTILLHSSFAVKTLSLAMHSLVSQTVKVCMQDSTWRATAPPVILQHVILLDCMHDQPFVTWPGEAKALPI